MTPAQPRHVAIVTPTSRGVANRARGAIRVRHTPRHRVLRRARARARCRTGRGRPARPHASSTCPAASARASTRSRSAPSGSTIVAWRSAARPGGGGPAPRLSHVFDAEVVVIAAGAEERRLRAELRHQARSRGRRGRRRRSGATSATFRCTWPITVASVSPSKGSRARIGELAEQAVDVERLRREARGHLTLPDLARAVPVDLDPVPVGVVEVQRLADEVIGEAGERNAVARGVRQPAREVGALLDEQREVVEPRVAGGRPGARLLDEHEQLARADAQRRPARAVFQHAQPDGAAVVVQRALEVGHRQVHGAHRRQRRDLAGRRCSGRLQRLWVARAHRGSAASQAPAERGAKRPNTRASVSISSSSS